MTKKEKRQLEQILELLYDVNIRSRKMVLTINPRESDPLIKETQNMMREHRSDLMDMSLKIRNEIKENE